VEESETGLAAEGAAVPRARLAAKADAAGEELVEATVRQNFADTMFWSPAVVTGADGKATVRIDAVADNLTTWRATARAMSAGGLVGQARETVVVRKDLIVRLIAPRFFTQGDVTTLTAIVHNYLDNPKDVQLEIAAEGLGLAGETVLRAQVGAQEERRFDWPATVPAAGAARITVKALTNEESDAMQLTVPVLPHGSLQWTSRSGLVEAEAIESFEVPEGAIHEATELLVVVSPTHAATVLDALDWLADYPYGCVEQTMSRFLPSVITRQVLRRLEIRKPWLEEQLPDMIRAGLQRLYDFQHGDGGWGWWQNDESNPFLTAYVVYGLALARDADVPVNDLVLRRGVAALDAHLGKGELSPVGRAMLALVLAKEGERAEAEKVLDALAAGAEETGGTAHWRAVGEYRWMGDATEATALALRAFLAVRPNHPLVPKALAWLALNRDGDHWTSTRQTALVVLAMSEYLALSGERAPDATIALELNGEAVWERRVTKENWHEFDGATRFDASKVRPGTNTVTIRKKGEGSPVYSIFLKHFRKADRFEASQGGLRVEREYRLLVPDGKERKRVLLADGATVAAGDEIEVFLRVKADRPYRYLVLEDPLPSGFEPEREPRPAHHARWGWWYATKAFRDEKVEIAITHLPQGEQTVAYVMRAETPGTFRVLPAAVWNMYRASEGANSSGFSVVTTALGRR
jgi:uncharacterized protein YfaS (alpha-2-macroglobulin family)